MRTSRLAISARKRTRPAPKPEPILPPAPAKPDMAGAWVAYGKLATAAQRFRVAMDEFGDDPAIATLLLTPDFITALRRLNDHFDESMDDVTDAMHSASYKHG